MDRRVWGRALSVYLTALNNSCLVNSMPRHKRNLLRVDVERARSNRWIVLRRNLRIGPRRPSVARDFEPIMHCGGFESCLRIDRDCFEYGLRRSRRLAEGGNCSVRQRLPEPLDVGLRILRDVRVVRDRR
jgi:hypothetical protein